jgi:oligoribonuclease NrnB/cAMP/cGMP phosphodiesterase (DHH superfamily)
VIEIGLAQLARVVGGTASSSKAAELSIRQLHDQASQLTGGGDPKASGGKPQK